MNRRGVVKLLITGGSIGLSGCAENNTNEIDPRVSIFPEVEPEEDRWKLKVRVRNDYGDYVSVNDISVKAFDQQGEEVCSVDMGTLPQNGPYDRTKFITCEEFPAIITAVAEESPCDGAEIRLLYYVGFDEPQDVEDLVDGSYWEGTWRECEENLPPGYVIEEVRQSGAGTDED